MLGRTRTQRTVGTGLRPLRPALALIIALLATAVWSSPSSAVEESEPTAAPVWSADMRVVAYTDVALGAASADLFANIGGSGNLQIKSLWSYTPDRDLRLKFDAAVANAAEYTLLVDDLALAFPSGSSGQLSFKWQEVDLDWTDGQIVHVRVVPTADVEAHRDTTRSNTPVTPADDDGNTSANGAESADSDDQPSLLVGNLSAGEGGSSGIQRMLNAARSGFAQAFTTGATHAESEGYTLASAGVQVTHFYDSSTVGDHLQVTINSVDSAGRPGEALCSLANPSSFSSPGLSVFGAPTGDDACPSLAAQTTYFVVVEWRNPSADGSFAYMPQTWSSEDSAAGDEDPGSAEGWSIADRSWYLGVSANVRTWTVFDDTASFRIELKGAVAAAAAAARVNSPATGLPTITGTARVGEILTADTIGIADDDGLENVAYRYQWLADGADIDGATGSSHTLSDAEQGKTIAVRVSFSDDATHEETLVSASTAPVARPLLTASVLKAPDAHDGAAFTFELHLSEEFDLSYKVLKEHGAFKPTGGEVTGVMRLQPGKNRTWLIKVKPGGRRRGDRPAARHQQLQRRRRDLHRRRPQAGQSD